LGFEASVLGIGILFIVPNREVLIRPAPSRIFWSFCFLNNQLKLNNFRDIIMELPYQKGDLVVYPTHGVGRVMGVETQEFSGTKIEVILINFDKEKMMLRVPVLKARNAGLRRLSSRKVMDSALGALKTKSRVKRAMWSRRAQEYETKINSGHPVAIAEVVRELYRTASEQEMQSYSERQMYQSALDRLVRELAAVEGIDEPAATARLEKVLSTPTASTAAA